MRHANKTPVAFPLITHFAQHGQGKAPHWRAHESDSCASSKIRRIPDLVNLCLPRGSFVCQSSSCLDATWSACLALFCSAVSHPTAPGGIARHDWALCQWLIQQKGLLCIPSSPFFSNEQAIAGASDDFVRIAFCMLGTQPEVIEDTLATSVQNTTSLR